MEKSGQHNLEASNSFPSSHDLYNYGELEGRQIIHKKTLAHGLIGKNCGSVLSLLDTTGEQQHGLAYVLYKVCRQCKRSNQVFIDKQHNVAGKGQRKHFDSNTKAVIGILNAGAGGTVLNPMKKRWVML
ncbi:hypothetical protein PV326_001341 [Microctonus aethiopoides]|nr:hypothetical protein PV326_001341 [Microctonus aethiopoides]